MTGYPSKKKAASAKTIDEFIEAENKKVSKRYGYVPKLHPSEWQDNLAQPAQKPKSFTYNEVADAMNSFRKGNSVQKAYAEEVGKLKLYAAPPQRPWVGLEGEEIRNLWEEATKPDRSTVTIVTSFARAIEAKLKDKNT